MCSKANICHLDVGQSITRLALPSYSSSPSSPLNPVVYRTPMFRRKKKKEKEEDEMRKRDKNKKSSFLLWSLSAIAVYSENDAAAADLLFLQLTFCV